MRQHYLSRRWELNLITTNKLAVRSCGWLLFSQKKKKIIMKRYKKIVKTANSDGIGAGLERRSWYPNPNTAHTLFFNWGWFGDVPNNPWIERGFKTGTRSPFKFQTYYMIIYIKKSIKKIITDQNDKWTRHQNQCKLD